MSTLTAPDAERGLVAAMLGRVSVGMADATDPIFRSVPTTHFAEPGLRLIWRAMTELAEAGVAPEPTSIASRLGEFGAADQGRQVYVLAAEGVDVGSPTYHAGILKDRAIRRRLAEAARDVGERAADLSVPLADLLHTAERSVFGVAEGGGLAYPAPVKKKLAAVFALIEDGGFKGVSTGYPDLDARLTGRGFLRGQLIVVAGATSMGKTALATGLACAAAVGQKRVTAFYSIEMTTEDNALRILCHEARADLKALAEGEATDGDMATIAQMAGLVTESPLFLESGARTVSEIRSSARRLKAEAGGLEMVIVDHLQDMDGPGSDRREQIGTICREMKAIAKELDTTIILVSQLSRAVNKRPDPRPRMDDLKEAGEIENNADTVLMLYRPEYYHGPEIKVGRGKNEKTIDVRNKAELIIAKQRMGETGVVPLTWVPHCVRYDSAASGRWS